MAYRVYPVHVSVWLYVFSFVHLCVPESCPTHNFIMRGGIWKLFGTNDIKTRQCATCMNHVAKSKVQVTASTLSLCISEPCPTHNFIWKLVGFEKYLAEIIITRRCVACKNHVAKSKVKVTVHTYSLCIGICVQLITSSSMLWFENYLAQMIIKTRQCVLCKNVSTSKVKFTVCTYTCAQASVKQFRVHLITLLSRLPQALCNIGIQFSIRWYIPSRSYLTTGTSQGASVSYGHMFF